MRCREAWSESLQQRAREMLCSCFRQVQADFRIPGLRAKLRPLRVACPDPLKSGSNPSDRSQRTLSVPLITSPKNYGTSIGLCIGASGRARTERIVPPRTGGAQPTEGPASGDRTAFREVMLRPSANPRRSSPVLAHSLRLPSRAFQLSKLSVW